MASSIPSTATAKPRIRRTRALGSTEVSAPRYLALPVGDESLPEPDPTATDYRTISQKAVYCPGVFNCQEREFLKEVTVSGMKLVWSSDGERALRELSEQRDLKRVTIVADSVHIDIPVRFPHSEVYIFARELVFTGSGSIDITPEANTVAPRSRFTEEAPAKSGDTGWPGNDGADAHSIVLNVQTLRVPEPVGDEAPVPRFYARGANGQPGAEGGLLPQEGVAVPPAVTWTSFYDKLTRTYLCTIPFGIPTTVPGHPGPGFPLNPEVSRLKTEQLQPCPTKLANVHVLHLDTTVHFPAAWFYLTNWKVGLGKKTPVPADGRNAYPSGRPGDGGKGGQVHFHGKLTDGAGDTFDSLVVVTGGEKGTSKFTDGDAPALDKPAACVKMEVSFKHEHIGVPGGGGLTKEHAYISKLELQDVSPKPGLGAKPEEAHEGTDGEISTEETTPAWVHEFNTEAALSYAKHACLVHNRALARRVATSYLDGIDASQHSLTPRVSALRTELETLLQRLDTDVDIFGNQNGWVPHLSALGTLKTFQTMVKQAFNSMYLCHMMKNNWSSMQNELEALTAMRGTLRKGLDAARERLTTSQKAYAEVGKELQQELADGARLRGELSTVVQEIGTKAEIDEKERAITLGGTKIGFGSLKLITGGLELLTQVIPVGQPFLGLLGGTGAKAAGGIFGEIEGVVSSVIAGEKVDVFSLGAGLTDKSAAFIKANQKQIGKVVTAAATRGLDTKLGATKKQLSEVGKETKVVAAELEDLKKLLGPEVMLSEQLDRLFRLEAREASVGVDELASEEQKKLAEWLKQTVGSRIDLLTAQGEKETTLKKLRHKREQADSLASKAGNLAKKKRDAEATVTTVLQGLAGMSGDVRDVLEGARSLCIRKEDLEPKIAAQFEKLKATEYGERLADIHARISSSSARKEERMRQLERRFIEIEDASASIRQTLATLDTVDHRALGLSGGLDHSVYSALVSLDREARSTIEKQLYYFAKSYEYRFLKRVDPDFYKLDGFVAKLEQFLATPPEAGSDGKANRVSLTQDDFEAMYDILEMKLRSQIDFVIDDLQHNRLVEQKKWLIHAHDLVDEDALQKLNQPVLGKRSKQISYEPVLFNLVRAGFATPESNRLRIVDLKLKSLSIENLDQFRQGLNFGIKFVHSGTSVLYDGEESFVFRAQTPAETASWEFTVSIDSGGKIRIKPVTVSLCDIELLQRLCGSQAVASELLATYRPGGASDLTVHRTASGGRDAARITDFVVEVVLEELHRGS